ncbi:crossover junction endodeoxyribonuclease RuvC [Alkalilimnicola ehrlichii MLHE-1]|uniref:Crossover junction endodeoxyribonuclease RuvC n=1 Tax=Alkalilimnicola ehrlichii (strain ATCC BAA-1101 / DSM 17681 / MLHE-1) TaxID=187272 RepID=RUVC_ALKEH|nr:crossover junction endodeoxyribonuclease RuvC [Alkalilimnicola ehrlichii]Q0A5Q4.1 RecName: Full=Crossover junction endodeoxyribonuclease RuvC; AltName: Full=Holliday junction nuclease RuvC; AltName: Full=Holliday junction resolvase RuvC [Alkalilimnicola ehrlichii MLHE-1]ABI57833.1 crossover junction endodeoxyribonuclease RuvC [Alkalilimnicola ehrlichii MLHE-1]
MPRILGIDPGSRITGYGVVEGSGSAPRHVASGCVRLPTGPFPDRLRVLYRALSELLAQHRPEAAVVEQVFVSRNPDSALKLGQARGAAICACVNAGLPVAEYTPGEIKQALVGHGRAGKAQVGYMVRMLLRLDATPAEDAGDALAAALCHLHQADMQARLRRAGA